MRTSKEMGELRSTCYPYPFQWYPTNWALANDPLPLHLSFAFVFHLSSHIKAFLYFFLTCICVYVDLFNHGGKPFIQIDLKRGSSVLPSVLFAMVGWLLFEAILLPHSASLAFIVPMSLWVKFVPDMLIKKCWCTWHWVFLRGSVFVYYLLSPSFTCSNTSLSPLRVSCVP